MSVLVQFTVKVSDVDRFVATSEKFAPMMQEMGGRQGEVYEDENEPGLVSTISDWDQPRPDACGIREARRPVKRGGGDRRARLDDPHLAPEGERLIRSPSGFRYLGLGLSGHRR
jgi:hypothetical protein